MKSSLSIAIQTIEPSGLLFESEEKPETFPVIADLINAEECRFIGPVRILGRIHRREDLIEVTGSVKITVRLACSRCLNDFETSLSEPFSFTFSQQGPESLSVPQPAEKELTADEFGLIHYPSPLRTNHRR